MTLEAVVQSCSVKKVFLEISQNSLENTSARVSFLIKLKKRLWHRCFPVNFVKFLRTPFLQNTFVGCFCHIYFKEMRHSEIEYILVNSFYPKNPFLNPLKTSENKRFSDVFRGYKNGIY